MAFLFIFYNVSIFGMWMWIVTCLSLLMLIMMIIMTYHHDDDSVSGGILEVELRFFRFLRPFLGLLV